MSQQPGRQSQRGAIIIHVAFALLALLVFTSVVIDYGVMWASRRQAQNVVDAAALAGALALNYGGDPHQAAQHFASVNAIWGQANSAANVEVTVSDADHTLPPCGAEPGCVRADVFRDAPDRNNVTRGDVIPTYFARLMDLDSQRVRATATAQAGEGTQINCLLPFAIIDRWADNHDPMPDNTYYPNDWKDGTPGWSANDDYEPAALPDPDVYIGPYSTTSNPNPAHTGWKVADDWGRQLIVKAGDIGDYSTGWAQRIDLPASQGANDYNYNILNCNTSPVGIASGSEPCSPAPGGDTTGREINGCVSVATGMAQGPTVQNGIDVLVDNDSALQWSSTAIGPLGIPGAPVDTSVTGSPVRMDSMRIRPIVVFDINHYEAARLAGNCTGTNCIGKVANIIGFFIEGTCGDVALDPGNALQCENPNKDIVGRIVSIPGQYASGFGNVSDDAAFILMVRLVR